MMKVREYEFDGTPDEYLKVANVLRGDRPQIYLPSGKPELNITETPETSSVLSKRFVTKEQAIRILTRRKLSKYMEKFIGELFRAGDKKVKSDQLRKMLGFDDDSDERGADRFRGLLGAFGRRVTHDVGAEVSFFDDEWNADEGQKEWRLPPSVHQAVEQLRWYR
jgi:hypothetical protein